jgi:hypothetical protein
MSEAQRVMGIVMAEDKVEALKFLIIASNAGSGTAHGLGNPGG